MQATTRNHVNILGSGTRTLMFAHGFGCDQNMWRRIYPAFLEDFRVVLFDYVGAGMSDSDAFDRRRYSTLKGYAQDVIEIADELQLREINFVGHSVGSIIGALATITRPELFTSLAMVSPSPCYTNDGDYRGGFELGDIEGLLQILESNQVAWSATMAPIIMGVSNTSELIDELETSFCRLDPDIAHHFAKVTFLSDNRLDLPLITVPTLILQSQEDAIAAPFVGRYVHDHVPASRLALMDTVGHCPHMSVPAVVIEQLRDFLNVHGAVSSTPQSH